VAFSDLIYELTGVPEKKQKKKFRRCRRQFLAVKLDNGAIRFYGSYNVRCSLPIECCVKCSRYLNVNVLVPAVEVREKGIRGAIESMKEFTWGSARKLLEKYVLPELDNIVSELENNGEVKLL